MRSPRHRLDDDAHSDSDIEGPEPSDRRLRRANLAQGASYMQPPSPHIPVGPPSGFQVVGGQSNTGWLRLLPMSSESSAAQYSQYAVPQGYPGATAQGYYPPYHDGGRM